MHGFIVVDVMYGAMVPMSFIFDTGAQNTVIFDKATAEQLPVVYDKEVTLMGADLSMEIRAYIARNLIFQIGKSSLFTKDVIVLKEDHLKLSETLGENIHGIMGADFTRGLIVQIDYDKNDIILFSSNKILSKRYTNFIKVKANFDHGKILMPTYIINEKRDSVYLNLLLDTGAGISAMFHNNTNDKIQLPTHYINGNLGRGMGGDISGIIGKVDHLGIGPFSFHNLVSYFQNVDRTYYDTQQFSNRNGLLGNVVLSNFTVLIDYVKEEVYLKPNKYYNKEIKYDRSGILLIAQGKFLNEIVIHGVLQNSPADKVGLQKGDHITSVTWHHLEKLSINYLSKLFSSNAGKRIPIKVKRGQKKLKFNLILDNLL